MEKLNEMMGMLYKYKELQLLPSIAVKIKWEDIFPVFRKNLIYNKTLLEK